MSEFKNDNIVIMHAFEKDGEMHSPVYAECAMCSYCVSKVVDFDFGGEIVETKCGDFYSDTFLDDFCSSFSFDESRMSEEQQDEYDRLKELGQAIDCKKEIKMNEDEFYEWRKK